MNEQGAIGPYMRCNQAQTTAMQQNHRHHARYSLLLFEPYLEPLEITD
jgi:hypothetical protein